MRNENMKLNREDDYIKLQETPTTPKEVNNSVVDELDNLMKDIDKSSTENIDDLSL